MRKFKISLLVPHETIIDAPDLGTAHTEAHRILHNHNANEPELKSMLHSVVEEKEENVLDFGPSPAVA